MDKPRFAMVWVSWARGVELPPVGVKVAYKNHPREFVWLFVAMARHLGVHVGDLPDRVLLHLNSPLQPSDISPPSGTSPEPQQLELFAPWDNV